MRILYFITLVLILAVKTVLADTIYIIGHKGSFPNQQNISDFSSYYLLKKKQNILSDHIIPINLPINHVLREQFSQVIFNRSPFELREYWERMAFRGITPPLVQNSEQAVIIFVSRIRGAIGYVSKKPENTSIILLGEFEL